MALVVPNVGEVRLLKYALNHTNAEDQVIKLYKNNYTPVEGSVAGDFTEATFMGYSALPLTGSSWSIATVVGVTTASYAVQQFTSSNDQPAENVYGYYIVDSVSGILLWAERFTDGPYAIAVNGDQISITPKLTGE